MGSLDVPGETGLFNSGGPGPVVKQSTAHFEIAANLIDQKVRCLKRNW